MPARRAEFYLIDRRLEIGLFGDDLIEIIKILSLGMLKLTQAPRLQKVIL